VLFSPQDECCEYPPDHAQPIDFNDFSRATSQSRTADIMKSFGTLLEFTKVIEDIHWSHLCAIFRTKSLTFRAEQMPERTYPTANIEAMASSKVREFVRSCLECATQPTYSEDRPTVAAQLTDSTVPKVRDFVPIFPRPAQEPLHKANRVAHPCGVRYKLSHLRSWKLVEPRGTSTARALKRPDLKATGECLSQR